MGGLQGMDRRIGEAELARRKMAVGLVASLLAMCGTWAQVKMPRPALVVLSKDESLLVIVDPATLKLVAKVPTGPIPHEVAVSVDGKIAVVTNYGADGKGRTLSVIDLDAQREVQRVDLGAPVGPHGVAFFQGKAWFTAEAGHLIERYNPETNRVERWIPIGRGRTHMLVFSRDGSTIYATDLEQDQVSYWNAQEGAVNQTKADGAGDGWVAVGKGPEGIDVSPDGKEVWAANSGDGTVSVIDAGKKKVIATIDVKTKRSNRLKFTPDGKLVLVSDLGSGDLIVMDAATRKEVKRLPLGKSVEGILVQPDGTRAFVAVSGDDKVAVVDLKTLQVTGTFAVGKDPDGMAWRR